MKSPLVTILIGSLALVSSYSFAADNAANTIELKTPQDKVSYTIGVDIGKTFKSQNVEINPDAFLRGLTDGIKGNEPLMSLQDMQATLVDFQKNLLKKRENEFEDLARSNLQKGEAFLAENKAKSGVVTLASGLQYKVLTAGNGSKPTAKDTVKVDYEGRSINGNEFDSSIKRGKPATFPVSDVIPGWTEVLQLMPVGSTWEVYVPPELAYGPRGLVGPIGPNETLIFKIHLIDIEKDTKSN